MSEARSKKGASKFAQVKAMLENSSSVSKSEDYTVEEAGNNSEWLTCSEAEVSSVRPSTNAKKAEVAEIKDDN